MLAEISRSLKSFYVENVMGFANKHEKKVSSDFGSPNLNSLTGRERVKGILKNGSGIR